MRMDPATEPPSSSKRKCRLVWAIAAIAIAVIGNGVVWYFRGFPYILLTASIITFMYGRLAWNFQRAFYELFFPFLIFVAMLVVTEECLLSHIPQERKPDFIALAAISFAILYSFI